MRYTRMLIGGTVAEDKLKLLGEAIIADGAGIEDMPRASSVEALIASMRHSAAQGKVLIVEKHDDGALPLLEATCDELGLESIRSTTAGIEEEHAFIRREGPGREITAYAVQDGTNLQPAITLAEFELMMMAPDWRGRASARIAELRLLDEDASMPMLAIVVGPTQGMAP